MADFGEHDRAIGALLGTFVGDALGMPFEGVAADQIPERLELEDARLGRGTYTDDTQMMIALAESLLRCGAIDEEDLARTFHARFDPARGYGGGTIQVLELWARGVDVREAASRVFAGRGSLGNGAAMRVAPVAVRFYNNTVALAAQARRSARVTHAHPEGIDGAAVQAAAVAGALDGRDPLAAAQTAASTEAFRTRLEALATTTHDLQPGLLRPTAPGALSSAVATVPAAVLAGTRSPDFASAVTFAIRAGGDTDTLGGMAGAIAGARFGASAIPERWIDGLEQGEAGRDYVVALARQLAERADHPMVSELW
jgi:poly(ADP-ribose) glycohydrolase ARH3